MSLKDLWEWSDGIFFVWVFFLGFSRYLVNPSQFYPVELSSFLFSSISFLGFSSTPRIFWIGAGLLFSSICLRLVDASSSYLGLFWRGKGFSVSLRSEGEAYLDRHGVRRFDD